MKKFLKKKSTIFISGIILAIIFIFIFYFTKKEIPEYNFYIAKRQDLVQEVSATGRINAVDDINLAFEKSGRIKNIYVETGDKVYKGQVLVELEKNEILAELSQARAGVASAKAKLTQFEAILEKEKNNLETLQVGTRTDEILVYQSKVNNAEALYNASIQSVIDKIGDAYIKSDDAIRNKIDPVFTDPRGVNPQIIFAINNSQLEIQIELNRSSIEQQLISWSSSLNITPENFLSENISSTETKLNEIKSFLEDLALAVNNLTANSEFSQATINTYKANIYTARTNISTAIVNLSSATEKLNTAYTALLIATNELTLKEASTPEEIASQESTVKQAEANLISQEAEIDLKESAVQASLAKLSKNSLRSPINGTITRQESQVGAIASPGEIIISVISENNLEIETNIVEADISYLKIGDKANLSLDAYGEGVIFKAEIVKIDPAASLIEGVANYKTTLELSEKDPRIKTGMTADLDIITNKLTNVIVIPYRAIIFKTNNEKIVRVLRKNNQVEEVPVQIGIIGNGSLVEITSGIKEGDKVITSIKK